jgi:hypothetical protein
MKIRWEKLIEQVLINLALTRKDIEFVYGITTEEIDRFISEKFGELMEKYDALSPKDIEVERTRWKKKNAVLFLQGIEETIGGDK